MCILAWAPRGGHEGNWLEPQVIFIGRMGNVTGWANTTDVLYKRLVFFQEEHIGTNYQNNFQGHRAFKIPLVPDTE